MSGYEETQALLFPARWASGALPRDLATLDPVPAWGVHGAILVRSDPGVLGGREGDRWPVRKSDSPPDSPGRQGAPGERGEGIYGGTGGTGGPGGAGPGGGTGGTGGPGGPGGIIYERRNQVFTPRIRRYGITFMKFLSYLENHSWVATWGTFFIMGAILIWVVTH